MWRLLENIIHFCAKGLMNPVIALSQVNIFMVGY